MYLQSQFCSDPKLREGIRMSKVQTLLEIISYQREHPEASSADISSVVGISERYLRECQKDIRELSFYLSKPLVERNELDLLMSKLDADMQHERVILHKLQREYLETNNGVIEIASPQDKPSNEYLQIGLQTPIGDRIHIGFWLERLLYDPLLWTDKEGKTHYQLASTCENVDRYSKWRVRLKENLHWSDGKPITLEDIAHSLAKSRLAPTIREIKNIDKGENLFILNMDDPLFPYKLGHVPVRPSHSPGYDTISGPFVLKKSKPPNSFHLIRNEDYYISNYPKIDRIDLTTFTRFPFAIKAVIQKELDIFPIRSLHRLHQWTSISPQKLSCRDTCYYLLVINRERGCLSSRSAIAQLKASIDYNAINLYLSGSAPENMEISLPVERNLCLKMGYLSNMPDSPLRDLSFLVASSLGVDHPDVVDTRSHSRKDVRAEVDVVLAQFYFGHGYSRLKRYFHSKGGSNIFGFRYPEIDSLIEKLDKTASMEERETIGKNIIRKLQEENTIILLAPCFEYVLSNLHIVSSPSLGSLTDLIINLSNISVKRERNIV